LDKYAVTKEQFSQFIEDTGDGQRYLTGGSYYDCEDHGYIGQCCKELCDAIRTTWFRSVVKKSYSIN
jgi:formylglycine-generating enzyme required for sulfatase activity